MTGQCEECGPELDDDYPIGTCEECGDDLNDEDECERCDNEAKSWMHSIPLAGRRLHPSIDPEVQHEQD